MWQASWTWIAAGLPTEGSNAQHPRAGDVARKDVPTAQLDERIGDVRERVRAMDWNVVVVINGERVVLGLLRSKELEKDPDLSHRASDAAGSEHIPSLRLHQGNGGAHDQAHARKLANHDFGWKARRLVVAERCGPESRRKGMSVKTATISRCSRCGTAVESCAFCDEPDCPATLCYRCLNVALLDRLRQKPIVSPGGPAG